MRIPDAVAEGTVWDTGADANPLDDLRKALGLDQTVAEIERRARELVRIEIERSEREHVRQLLERSRRDLLGPTPPRRPIAKQIAAELGTHRRSPSKKRRRK
jgi:hypothetical protein